jgi:hypothetical protein
MKIIIRTLVILVAALIVVAAAVGFAQSSFAVALAPGMPAEERGAAPVLVTSVDTSSADVADSTSAFTAATSTTAGDTSATGTATAGSEAASTIGASVFAGGGARPDHDAAGSIQGAVPLAKNFGMMALIVGVVALASQGVDRLRRRMHLQVR